MKVIMKCVNIKLWDILGCFHNILFGLNSFLNVFKTSSFMMKAHQQKQPSFLNRLVGTEDDQLESICSPYTARYVCRSVF